MLITQTLTYKELVLKTGRTTHALPFRSLSRSLRLEPPPSSSTRLSGASWRCERATITPVSPSPSSPWIRSVNDALFLVFVGALRRPGWRTRRAERAQVLVFIATVWYLRSLSSPDLALPLTTTVKP